MDISKPLRELVLSVADFIYPPHCLICGALVNGEDGAVCEECWSKLKPIEGPHCGRCGSPLGGMSYGCPNCSGRDQLYLRARVLTPFSGEVQAIIHLFKYRGKRGIGRRLGAMLSGLLISEPWISDIDVICPVPLHPSRERERGYNQSAVLAESISSEVGIPFGERLLQRVRNTPSQTGLSLPERVENVSGAFRVKDPSGIYGKNVLLVDDVLTTGATVNACADALLSSGANSVSVAAVASPFVSVGR